MRKIKNIIRNIVFRFIKPPVVTKYNSNSQAGEDRVISYLFDSMGINNISYIDIGANDPVHCNNTYLFYNNNHRGVLVEPDLSFKKNIETLRPRDVVINAAISDKGNQEVDFYILIYLL
jgi:hypothetical protein